MVLFFISICYTKVTMGKQSAAILVLCVILLPSLAWAQDVEFQNLVNIPGLNPDEGAPGLAAYLETFFYTAVGIAALLAVVKLVIAGARYMLSDVANQKEAAKADIRGAIIGLLIVLATVTILLTINPQILQLQLALPTRDGGIADIGEEGCIRLGGEWVVNEELQEARCGTLSFANAASRTTEVGLREAREVYDEMLSRYDRLDSQNIISSNTAQDFIINCRNQGGTHILRASYDAGSLMETIFNFVTFNLFATGEYICFGTKLDR